MKQGSFRDPDGYLINLDNRILRVIKKDSVEEITAFLGTETARTFINADKLIDTYQLKDPDSKIIRNRLLNDYSIHVADQDLLVEHEKIDFPSYPYEWSPEILYQAGKLTLELAEVSLDAGYSLKDATPYNILFRNSKPVFIDLLSFELRDPCDYVWLPHAQFSRTFLLPLLASKYFDITPDQVFITRRDGLEPEEVYRLSGSLQKIKPQFLSEVTIPAWLGKNQNSKPGLYKKKLAKNPDQARFTFKHLLGRLNHSLEKLKPAKQEKSHWSEYMHSAEHYSEDSFKTKRAFVEKAVRENSSAKVLDVGCNTGYFSALAAENGAEVVAIDNDPVVIDKTWQLARAKDLEILPLVVDISRPTPSTGWRNKECPGFLHRADRAFDMVFMLAVIHHLICSEGIPLEEILSLAHQLTRGFLVIEYIPPEDPKFRQISRGRDHLFEHLSRDCFEATSRQYFNILASESLEDGERMMYLLQRKDL